MYKPKHLEISIIENIIHLGGIDLQISFDDVFKIQTQTGKSSKKILLHTWKDRRRQINIDRILNPS